MNNKLTLIAVVCVALVAGLVVGRSGYRFGSCNCCPCCKSFGVYVETECKCEPKKPENRPSPIGAVH